MTLGRAVGYRSGKKVVKESVLLGNEPDRSAGPMVWLWQAPIVSTVDPSAAWNQDEEWVKAFSFHVMHSYRRVQAVPDTYPGDTRVSPG